MHLLTQSECCGEIDVGKHLLTRRECCDEIDTDEQLFRGDCDEMDVLKH